ncbi:MAG: hypothetical protein OEY63_07360 [Gemmatimonadota bacterium]|nr:hypothetical protein [Gemmatimonadota bacterium]
MSNEIPGTGQGDRAVTADERARVLPFRDDEEFRTFMRHPEYKESKWLREIVQIRLAKSDPDIGLTQNQRDEARKMEEVDVTELKAAQMDYIRQLTRDPKYKTSAAHRYHVIDLIKQYSGNDGDVVGKTLRVAASTNPHRVVEVTGHGLHRIQVESEMTGPNKPDKPATKFEPHPDVIDLDY